MKASRNFSIEKINNNSYYMVNKKGVKYLVENDTRYMGDKNTDPVLEKFNYPGTPSITDVLSFNDRESFECWLATRAATYTNVNLHQARMNFQKGSLLLSKLAHDWMNNRDTSIYTNKDYIYESIHCGLYVSGEIKKNGDIGKWCLIDKLCKTIHLLNLNNKSLTVVDLGAGLGLTSLWMAYVMPKSHIYYVDASPESQQIVKEMSSLGGINNLSVVNTIDEIKGEIDIATGFEFVEHIEDKPGSSIGNPFLGIEDVLKRLSAEGVFMYSTMWNAEQNNGSTIGHFLEYKFDNKTITMPAGKSSLRSRKHHRFFVEGLKSRGFKLINGGRKGSLWDFKGHTPYCFIRDTHNIVL